MTRRTLILLIIAIVVWGFAIYFLLFSPWGIRPKSVSTPKPVRKPVVVKKIPLTSSILDEYASIVEKGLKNKVDMFKAKELGLSPEELNTLIMKSKASLRTVKFVGYIIEGNEGEIFLKVKDEVKPFDRNSLILNRYLIIHVSSLGLVVLDLEEGGLETIK